MPKTIICTSPSQEAMNSMITLTKNYKNGHRLTEEDKKNIADTWQMTVDIMEKDQKLNGFGGWK